MLLVVPKMFDWSGGVTLLGLGDIALPGLLVAFSLRVDVIKSVIYSVYWNSCAAATVSDDCCSCVNK
jgi:hypothetical protein